MKISLVERNALILNGTSEVNITIATELVRLGASVTLVGNNKTAINKAVDQLNQITTPHAHLAVDMDIVPDNKYIIADITDREDLKNKLTQYRENNPPIHIIVNNTELAPIGPAKDSELDEYLNDFQLKLINNQLAFDIFHEDMWNDEFGRIINNISTSVVQPIPNMDVSNTTMGAISNWAKTLSGEVAEEGITVNNILAGAIKNSTLDTYIKSMALRTRNTVSDLEEELIDKIPVVRIGESRDIANLTAFLASPASSYITGVDIPVDGGYRMFRG